MATDFDMRPSAKLTVSVVAFCGLLLATGQIGARTSCPISGVVLTRGGKPVPGAAVWAIPVHRGGWVGDFHEFTADGHGRFRLLVSPGEYVIRAKSNQEGYPDPNAVISSDPTAHFPMVTVTSKGLTGIIVRLGKKGAILEGYIYDARSGSPVSGAKVTFRGAHNAGWVTVTCDREGKFRYVVPSKPITISVVAPGYSVGRFDGGEAVVFPSGSRRTISIALTAQ